MELKLFKSVWNNIYIFKYIFKFAKLYKKNEIVTFKDLASLRNYPEREYINKIIYKGTKPLKKGDLPSSIAIKEIVFTKIELSSTPGQFIPEGVEILTYSNYGWKHYSTNLSNGSPISNSLTKKLKTTPLSSLPTTIHTIYNALILLQPHDNINNNIIIPPNIKSISIINSPIITETPDPYLKIPNTLETLVFKDKSNLFNGDLQLKPGDIPNSISKLSINKYRKPMLPGTIPTSITDLSVTFYRQSLKQSFQIEESLVLLESLHISFSEQYGSFTVSPHSNLMKLKHLKKLTISMGIFGRMVPNSIPPSVKELKLCKRLIMQPFDQGIIPNGIEKLILFSGNFDLPPNCIPASVKSLTISSNSIFTIPNLLGKANDVFPPSLTHLEILSKRFPIKEFRKFIPSLPKSITTLTLIDVVNLNIVKR